ncbi:MAG: hypothetical protein HOJ79_14610 [Nitrospina sp.]|nr:hypothetical protein [Nitrospina sp.]
MPELEVEYQKFLKRVHDETDNPQWNIDNHPAHQVLGRYQKGFGKWVAHLENILLLKQGGYRLENNDLSLTEWKALALLEKIQTSRYEGNE